MTETRQEWAKNLSIEVWEWFYYRPELKRKESDLPVELYNKIKNLDCACPLCEILSCNECPLRDCNDYPCFYRLEIATMISALGTSIGLDEFLKL